MDTAALASLSTQRAGLLDEATVLSRRIELLSTQKAGAEKAEASTRMAAIADELALLVETGTVLRHTWDTTLASIIEQTRAFLPAVQRSQQLAYDREFLKHAYQIDLPPVAALPVPHVDGLRSLEDALSELLRSTYNPFAIRQQALLDERARNEPKPEGVSVSWRASTADVLNRQIEKEKAATPHPTSTLLERKTA